MKITVEELEKLIEKSRINGMTYIAEKENKIIDNYKEKNETLEATNKTLHSELSEAKNRIAELEKFNVEWEDENKKLKDRIEGIKQASVVLNINMPFELAKEISKWFMKNPQNIDWNDEDMEKYCIYCEDGTIYTDYWFTRNYFGLFYFKSENIAEEFIAEIGEDKLIAYFESLRWNNATNK